MFKLAEDTNYSSLVKGIVTNLRQYQDVALVLIYKMNKHVLGEDKEKLFSLFNKHIMAPVKSAYSNIQENPNPTTIFNEFSKIISEVQNFKQAVDKEFPIASKIVYGAVGLSLTTLLTCVCPVSGIANTLSTAAIAAGVAMAQKTLSEGVKKATTQWQKVKDDSELGNLVVAAELAAKVSELSGISIPKLFNGEVKAEEQKIQAEAGSQKLKNLKSQLETTIDTESHKLPLNEELKQTVNNNFNNIDQVLKVAKTILKSDHASSFMEQVNQYNAAFTKINEAVKSFSESLSTVAGVRSLGMKLKDALPKIVSEHLPPIPQELINKFASIAKTTPELGNQIQGMIVQPTRSTAYTRPTPSSNRRGI